MDRDTDIPDSFGQYLKRERVLREISVEEIAAFTRIKLRALEAIERDDFASLPPLAFVRAFIRCYADYIGLNVPDVMLRFDTFVQNRYPELTGEVPLIAKKQRPRQRYVPLALGIFAVVIVAFVYWLSRSPTTPESAETLAPPREEAIAPAPEELVATSEVVPTGPEEETVESSPPPEQEPETAPATEEPIDSGINPAPESEASVSTESRSDDPLGPSLDLAVFPSEEGAEEENGEILHDYSSGIRHRVTVTVKKSCWIQFLIDEDEARQLILQPDQTVTFEAISSVKIKFGNPDGIATVTHNDRTVDFKPLCSPWWLNFPPGENDNNCP